MKTHDQHLHILRLYEIYCYRVCYFLLQNEVLASESSKTALLELFRHESFFQSSESEKKRIVYKVATKHSLQTYYDSLSHNKREDGVTSILSR